jgi:hypothetical protein
MDKMVKSQIAILNLTGGLSTELTDYFAQKQIVVIDPEVDASNYQWTHILTKNVHDFTHLRGTYDTIENDVRIISLSTVDDLQHFIGSNGKLILDEVWMQNSLGSFILDKFFQEYGGIALGDNYPSFKEQGSFIIANPFNTGEYLDRLVHNAFMDGVSALSIKTFFDHLVMYLTGLKTKGKLGMPLEVTYGNFNDVFAVQFHFFTKDLILEDVTASLSSKFSKQAEEYLLNVAVQSSDFFDFTLLKEVNKTVITALWTKDARIKIENRGLLFNEVSSTAAITNYPSEGATSFQMSNPFLEDFSEKIVLPAGPVELDNHSETVKGSEEEIPEVQVIHGTEVEDEIITLVKGKVEEEQEQVFRISGEKFDVDNFAFRVSSGIEDKAKGDNILKIKSLKDELPDAIKNSFQLFTQNLNKSMDAISEEDLEVFKEVEVPKIIKETTKKIDTQFKVAAAAAAAANKISKSTDPNVAALNSENESLKSKVKTLMTEVKILKEAKLAMAEAHAKSKNEAEVVIQTVQTVDNNDTSLKVQMIQKMQEQKSLNEQDTKKLAALMERETKYLKDAKENEIQLKKLQIEFVQKESIFAQEIEKVIRLAKSKDLILTKTKEGLSKLVEQKDKELKSTTEKLNQASKALASNQTQNQANMIRELERKVLNHEKMIEIYKNKISQKPAAKAEDETSKEDVRRIQMMNATMKNQLDMAKKEINKYQERIATDTAALNTLKTEKNKTDALLKKAMLDSKKEEIAAAGNTHTDQDYKNLQAQLELLESSFKENQTRYRDMEGKLQDALRAQKKEVVSDDQSTKGKTAHLEGNVRKLTQDLVEAKNQLAEMKKETNKLRQEKTALQNLADKMKKEADKTKAAAPKKPTGGKAA